MRAEKKEELPRKGGIILGIPLPIVHCLHLEVQSGGFHDAPVVILLLFFFTKQQDEYREHLHP